MNASFQSDAYVPDGLTAGNESQLVGEKVTIILGQDLKRGSLLGRITANNKCNLSLSAASDGSEEPDLILAEDCNATVADTEAMAYSRGDFNVNAVIFGTGHTSESVKDGLRNKNIVFLDSVER